MATGNKIYTVVVETYWGCTYNIYSVISNSSERSIELVKEFMSDRGVPKGVLAFEEGQDIVKDTVMCFELPADMEESVVFVEAYSTSKDWD